MVINIVLYTLSIFVHILMIIVYHLSSCVSKNCHVHYHCHMQRFYHNLVMVTINSFNTVCICTQILIYLNDDFIVCHLLWQWGDTTTFVTIVKKKYVSCAENQVFSWGNGANGRLGAVFSDQLKGPNNKSSCLPRPIFGSLYSVSSLASHHWHTIVIAGK